MSRRDEIAQLLEREYGFLPDPVGVADRILACVAVPSDAMVEAAIREFWKPWDIPARDPLRARDDMRAALVAAGRAMVKP